MEIALHIVHTIVHICEIILNILKITLTLHRKTGPSGSQRMSETKREIMIEKMGEKIHTRVSENG